jgi:hypothetical protein
VGAIDRAAPGVGQQEVEGAFVTAYATIGMPVREPLPESVVEQAGGRADRHRVPEG